MTAHYSCVSIGFIRDDGDLQVLATLNNNDKLISGAAFSAIIANTRLALSGALHGVYVTIVFEREDAPDYVTLGEWE